MKSPMREIKDKKYDRLCVDVEFLSFEALKDQLFAYRVNARSLPKSMLSVMMTMMVMIRRSMSMLNQSNVPFLSKK